MNAVFRYAVKTGLGTYNTAADMQGVPKSRPVEHLPAVLGCAGKLLGAEGLIFPIARDSNKPMSDNAMPKTFRDMGYKGKATPHGFRSSFSSMANEKSVYASEVIEKALAHEEQNKIRAAYNRAEYLEQRRELLQWWGDLL
uniref:tyrosine-type recombinase/integrase n=1 Tax=Candidatus Electrothrix sp. TaxID=2170559 RepID=UPI0040572559